MQEDRITSKSGSAAWDKVKDASSMATTLGAAVLTTAAVFYPPIATFLDVQVMKKELHEVNQVMTKELHEVKGDVQTIKMMLEQQNKRKWFG